MGEGGGAVGVLYWQCKSCNGNMYRNLSAALAFLCGWHYLPWRQSQCFHPLSLCQPPLFHSPLFHPRLVLPPWYRCGWLLPLLPPLFVLQLSVSRGCCGSVTHFGQSVSASAHTLAASSP